jgi:hypothetical protein
METLIIGSIESIYKACVLHYNSTIYGNSTFKFIYHTAPSREVMEEGKGKERG